MIPHGSPSGYSYYGCRCEKCRRTHAEYARAWQRKRFGFEPFVDAKPAKEMLSCLLGFGVQPGKIGAAMGKGHRGKPRLRCPKVKKATHDALSGLHWGLFMSHGAFRRHCRCEAPAWVLEELEKAA